MTLPLRFSPAIRAACLLAACFIAAPIAHAGMTLRLEDYATAPKTGATGSEEDPITFGNSVYLARINFLADDPVNSNRMFVNDLNGPLYMLDKTTKSFTQYLDFNGRGTATGLFDRMYRDGGFAAGLVTFQFDPDYANNGKFYTVHVEQGTSGSTVPSNASFPGLNTAGYSATSTIHNPGSPNGSNYRNVLVEWTDTNLTNSTFEGSARELLRIGQRDRIHPMGDIIFNPTATPSDPDWRMMYISIGDAGNGEQGNAAVRMTPQRLDSFGGKIIRIRPDNAGANTPLTLSGNSRYYVPNSNPFTNVADSDVRDEIYAAGFRNPHRMSWDVDPENPASNNLIVDDIGLHTWEEVNIVHAGANYGYSEREGNELLLGNNTTSPTLPTPDEVTLRITDTTSVGPVTPKYPVIQYGHGLEGQTGFAGDSVSSGYVYRGSNIPSLYGKYVFGEITTGQLFWADYAEMLAVDDGNAATLAEIHTFEVLWDDPNAAGGEELYATETPGGAVLGPMHQIVEAGYEARGGTDPNLPAGAAVTGSFGRADIRIQVDAAGELYIISKSDGMIRYIVEAVGNADFNDDNQVDGQDFLIWQRNLGGAGGLAEGDADGDGRVTSADLGYIKQQFGSTPPIAAVPEPTAAWLALIGLAAFRRRR
jgi:hypothetical protein